MWRGGLGRTYLLPPLSSGGALVVPPWLRFHIPLIEPDRQISRIRLSDKTSRFRVQRHLQLLTHLSELIGCPISRSFTTYCVCPELRSLPSTGVTRLPRYYDLSVTPGRPACPSRASGWSSLPTPWVSRVTYASLCTCCRHYPAQRLGVLLRSFTPAVSAFPERVVGSACASSFSRLARRSLALRPAHSRCHRIS